MTVRENVMVGTHAISRRGFLANALATSAARAEEKQIAERADALIQEFRLGEVADRLRGSLGASAPLAPAAAAAPAG